MAPTPFLGVQPPLGLAPEGIVTPEAVVLEFETAGPGSRSAAALIDLLIAGFVILIVSVAGSAVDASSALPGWFFYAILAIVAAFLLVGYPVLFETLWRGKTPGKALFGLRVVTVEGSPIGFRHAAVRAAVGVFEIRAAFGAVAFITAFLQERNQRLGDIAAGTLVLRDRMAQATPRATTFLPPAGTEDFVASLDTSMLQSPEYQTIRSFLTRSSAMQASARDGLARTLAHQFVDRTHSVPPEGLSPEGFLLCVAAAYQRRFAPVAPQS